MSADMLVALHAERAAGSKMERVKVTDFAVGVCRKKSFQAQYEKAKAISGVFE